MNKLFISSLALLTLSACFHLDGGDDDFFEDPSVPSEDTGEDDHRGRFCRLRLNGIAVDQSTDTAIVVQRSQPDCRGAELKSLYAVRSGEEAPRHLLTMEEVRRVRILTPGETLRVTARDADDTDALEIHDVDPQTLSRRWSLERSEVKSFHFSPQGRFIVFDMHHDTPTLEFEQPDRRVLVDTSSDELKEVDLLIEGVVLEFHWRDEQTAVISVLTSSPEIGEWVVELQVWDMGRLNLDDPASHAPVRRVSLKDVPYSRGYVHAPTNSFVAVGGVEFEGTPVAVVDLGAGDVRQLRTEAATFSADLNGTIAEASFLSPSAVMIVEPSGFSVLDPVEGVMTLTHRVESLVEGHRVVRDRAGAFALVETFIKGERDSDSTQTQTLSLVDLSEDQITELTPRSLLNTTVRPATGEFWGQDAGTLFRIDPEQAVLEEFSDEERRVDALATLELSDQLVFMDKQEMSIKLINPDTLAPSMDVAITPSPR